jgi:hypothetical protein
LKSAGSVIMVGSPSFSEPNEVELSIQPDKEKRAIAMSQTERIY